MVTVCSPGYRPFLQSVQGHVAELQKCPTTTAPSSSVRGAAAAALARSNSVPSSQADTLPVAASSATAVNVDSSLTPTRLDSRGDRRPDLDSPSDVPLETRTDSDSRCVVS